ncbi:MAG: radical SAM protein [Spirochaetales bacterium]|nr:radical SAM protein [Spirochaetales bacterium]
MMNKVRVRKRINKKNIPLIFARGVMVKYFHASWPIWIDFRITYRCNLRCRYCDMPSSKIGEMSTDQAKMVIDKINAPGRVILLTGGEPLVRKDIGEIVDYFAFHSDCEVRFNTNLVLLKKRYDEIKNCDGFFFSLDGTKKTHEENKGEGSFKGVEEGLEILHSEKRGKISMTVITGNTTLDDIKFVLDTCAKYEIVPAFQMVRHYELSKESREINPEMDNAVKIFEYLLEERKKGFIMMNSRKGLIGQIKLARALANTNGDFKASCYSGKLLCTVDSDGIVGLCFSRPRHTNSLNLTQEQVTFNDALKALHTIKPHTKRCPTCTCMAPIEFSLCNLLNVDVLLDNYHSEKEFQRLEKAYTARNHP